MVVLVVFAVEVLEPVQQRVQLSDGLYWRSSHLQLCETWAEWENIAYTARDLGWHLVKNLDKFTRKLRIIIHPKQTKWLKRKEIQ